MKKKELLLLLALFTFVSADAEVDLATNLLYSVSGDAITITGYNGTIPENYSLVIPSQIEGKNVTAIAASAFAAQSHSGCGNITSIELPQTLTSIGELAFQGVNCSTITFPSGITSLPHGVIANNSHLKEICFEGNITSLGSWCFSEDYNVERLVFYANTTPPAGGSSSFYLFNSSLCKVYVPRGSSSNWGSTWYGFEVIEGTLQKDTEGYYLLKTKQNWIEFSAIVLDEPAANARMIADIDLGDDQTTIGSPRNGGTVWYQGTFDGDGHTLTIAYNNTNGEIFTTPFTLIQGATIKNLHIDGTVNTVYAYGGSVASIGRGSNTLKNIWNSVTSVCTMGGWDQMGAFFGVLESGSSMDVSDCLFTGSMSHPGGYSGYFSGGYGPGPNVSNCLVLGEFTGSYGFNGTFTNCYLKHASTTGVTIPTDEQLSDGTIATALGDAWAQDPELGIPLPKIFVTLQDEEGYYLIGSVTDWNRFAALINNGTEPAANARMIRDVEISTTIGVREDKPFSGTFDGNGHILTANITSTATGINGNDVGVAPFHFIKNATIKNLKVDGIINSSSIHSSGLVGVAYGTNLVVGCVVSAKIKTSAQYVGGIIAHGYDSNTTVKDCLFNGIIEGGNRIGVIWAHNHGGTGNIINCLENGSYTNSSYVNPIYRSEGGTINCSNNYYITGNDSRNNKVTDEELSNGTTATALQAGRSEEVWVQDPELGIPMLKIFANTGEEVPVTDLSSTETANTYIVSAAGKYKFKATVKGNGGLDPLTGTIATPIDPASIAGVKVLWELGDTYGRAIKYEDSAYDISYSDGYVYFSTPNSFTTGVACVAIYDSSDNILWSWDIWSTPEPGTVTHNGNIFMDRNLGAIDLNNNRGFLYQWGRKDAFSAATGSYASFTFVPALFTAFNTVRGIQTIDYCIKHPTTHVNNGDENSWMSRDEYNTLPWRDDIKTIYDPCPAGWRVPTAAEQNGYSGLPGTGFSNAINEFGNPGSGYYRSSTISSYPRAYAFRQSGQQNNWGTNPAFAIRPVKEGIYFIYTVPASGLGTFSAAENVIIPAGLTAYYCTTLKTYEDGKLGVRVSKLNGIIPANTGVLLEGTPGLSYPLTATTVEAAAPAENSLVAVVESEHIPATNGEYTNFMMKGGKFIRIADDNASMPANRAYLPLLTEAISGSNAKEIMLYWDDEEATGVERMRNAENEKMRNGNIYNLNGQRLSAPQKGINIINGRKVIVK